MDPLFQPNQELISQWGLRLAVLFLCLPVHEFAHAWAANKLGDDTAARQGRLTLNPFVHLDIIGGIVLLYAGFGWAKPVPVDTRAFKRPRRDMALVAAAGPLANIIMATIMLAVIKIVAYNAGIGPLFAEEGTMEALFELGSLTAAPSSQVAIMVILRYMLIINLILACFNLLPVPPLDGSKFFGALLPERAYFGMMRYERFVLPLLLLLALTGRLGPVLVFLSSSLFAVIDIVTWPIDLLLGG